MTIAKRPPQIVWPENKSFAFSIFDDTDHDKLDNTRPVYDLLAACGYRTTKSCWVRRPGPTEIGNCPGRTTEDPVYLGYLLNLQQKGFEIGLHNVSWASSTREQIQRGLERFQEQFGHPPKTFANHTGTSDSIYWGSARLSGVARICYNLLTRFRNTRRFSGHVQSSPYFWGDLCQRHIQYVRNFTYSQINTLAMCPMMPYHDPARPFVNDWFSSCDGHKLPAFLDALSDRNQDLLEASGGCCIMYTHFGSRFATDGRPHQEFERLMRRLATKCGWFVPVGELLDYIKSQRGDHILSSRERSRLEWRWLMQKVRLGRTS